MKIISDMDDASYYEKRAIELIHEAESARVVMQHPCRSSEACYNTYHSNINKAIKLLALARIVED